MPAYRSGESRTLVKSTGKWVKNKNQGDLEMFNWEFVILARNLKVLTVKR